MDNNNLLSQEGMTQGDPLAMPMYALATILFIRRLEGNSKQVWYADDSAALGKLADLKNWWDKLTCVDPKFGYFANASKSWPVTKESCHDYTFFFFTGTGVHVTQANRLYLNAAIVSREFIDAHVESKINSWLSCIIRLARVGGTGRAGRANA